MQRGPVQKHRSARSSTPCKRSPLWLDGIQRSPTRHSLPARLVFREYLLAALICEADDVLSRVGNLRQCTGEEFPIDCARAHNVRANANMSAYAVCTLERAGERQQQCAPVDTASVGARTTPSEMCTESRPTEGSPVCTPPVPSLPRDDQLAHRASVHMTHGKDRKWRALYALMSHFYLSRRKDTTAHRHAPPPAADVQRALAERDGAPAGDALVCAENTERFREWDETPECWARTVCDAHIRDAIDVWGLTLHVLPRSPCGPGGIVENAYRPESAHGLFYVGPLSSGLAHLAIASVPFVSMSSTLGDFLCSLHRIASLSMNASAARVSGMWDPIEDVFVVLPDARLCLASIESVWILIVRLFPPTGPAV